MIQTCGKVGGGHCLVYFWLCPGDRDPPLCMTEMVLWVAGDGIAAGFENGEVVLEICEV